MQGTSLRAAVRQACPRDVPGPPSTANDGNQQQPVKLKLTRGLSPRVTRENPARNASIKLGSLSLEHQTCAQVAKTL